MERLFDDGDFIYPNGLLAYRPWRQPYVFKHNIDIEKHLSNMAIYNHNERVRKKMVQLSLFKTPYQ